MIRTARAILRKDLLIELRTKESVPAMVLFSITVYVLFHFGLDRDSLDGELASGVLWVTMLLAAVIGSRGCSRRSASRAASTGCCWRRWTAPRCSWRRRRRCSCSSRLSSWWPCRRSPCCCWARASAGHSPSCWRYSRSANLGVAAVGALVAALAAETRARELIVPLLLLPLLVPLLIACAQATEPLLRQNAGPEDLGRWLLVLTLYDVVFVLLSVAVFDFLLED